MATYTHKNRIKSHPMSGTKSVGASETLASAVQVSWAVPDDVYVVGAQMELEIGSVAIGQKGTGENVVSAELARAGTGFNDMMILRLSMGRVEEETAGAHPVHEMYKFANVIFPEGVGMEFDEGEYINLIAAFNNASTAGRIMKVEAVVYYIERN